MFPSEFTTSIAPEDKSSTALKYLSLACSSSAAFLRFVMSRAMATILTGLSSLLCIMPMLSSPSNSLPSFVINVYSEVSVP